MLLARPIARLTIISFNLLAPFMIMVVCFAAFQATRQFLDLVVLFVIGFLGVLLKRFGWSRPAFLIGFVLAPQVEGYLNLAVQFYGWSMFTRPGVVIILAIALVSVWLGARGRASEAELVAHSDAVTSEFPVLVRGPQLVFIAGAAAVLGYAIWSTLRLSPLGSMFPLSVAIVTLALCAVLVGMLTRGSVETPANVDLEYGAKTESSDLWYTVAWFAALIGTTAAFGFILGTLVFFLLFLRLKAQVSWQRTLALSASAIVVLIAFTNLLFVELPPGVLSFYLDIPWLLGQAR